MLHQSCCQSQQVGGIAECPGWPHAMFMSKAISCLKGACDWRTAGLAAALGDPAMALHFGTKLCSPSFLVAEVKTHNMHLIDASKSRLIPV